MHLLAIKRINSNMAVLALLVALSLFRGMIYASVVPLWQAPDEPRHFEYIALLLDKGRLVHKGDLSPAVSQDILTSLRENRFEELERPLLETGLHSGVVPDIPGPSELEHPPLYYLLNALLLKGLPLHDVSSQAYVVRLFSVVLGTLVVVVAFFIAQMLFASDPLLCIGIPAFVALLPTRGFMDAAINNDVLIELLVSLVLLVVLRIFRDGFTLTKLGLVALLATLAALTKRTSFVLVSLILSAIVLYVLVPTGRHLKRLTVSVRVSILLGGSILIAAIILTQGFIVVGRPAEWVIWMPPDGKATLQRSDEAVAGKHSIEVKVEKSSDLPLLQLRQKHIMIKQGADYVLTFWGKAEPDRNIVVQLVRNRSPYERLGLNTMLALETGWQKYTLRFKGVATDSESLFTFLLGGVVGGVWIDDVVLRDVSALGQGGAVTADGSSVIRNGSGEQPIREMQPWLQNLVDLLEYNPAAFTWDDHAQYGPQYGAALGVLFETFWASFGWRSVWLDQVWYQGLALLSLIALLGLVLLYGRILSRRSSWPAWLQCSLMLLGICFLSAIVMAVFRAPPASLLSYLPHGRYLFVAVIPIATLFLLGWRELLPCHWHRGLLVTLICVFFLLDSISLVYYILPAFYGRG
ncbi:MAG: DUF2142 domain-containing protein [Chloroflexi bacterium]|nr:DUF2142 domain-containing protein [Chloroflexota bacterium]MCL5074255.1 DUF2142 domain-containing protein [Chloroflexota bacterium]